MTAFRKLRSVFLRLYRNPGFSLLAVTTLAVALGASIALYAVVEAVLLEPLPYRDSGRLVAVWEGNESIGWEKARVTPGHYWLWKEQRDVFEQMAIYGSTTHTLQTDTDPLQIAGTRVSREFFPLLGIGARLGRVFGEIDYGSEAAPVAIVSHALWTQVLGSDPDAVGRSLQLDGRPVTVVGVLAPDIVPVRAASGRVDFDTSRPRVWVPYRSVPDVSGQHVHGILARLTAGTTPSMAKVRLDALLASLEQERGFSVVVVPLSDELVGDIRASLQMLMAAVFLVLLVAVLNVSNLVIVRTSARGRELAVRTALGASRWRLLGDSLVEAGVLTVAAAGVGLALAWGLLEAFQLRPPVDIPRLADASLAGPFLRFGVPVTIATSLLFALASLRSGSIRLGDLAGTGKGTAAAGSSPRLRQLLVAAEMAVTVVLVIGSGLLLKSFYQLTSVDPGFRNTQVLAVTFDHTAPRYQEMAALNNFYDELLTQLDARPEVTSVAASYDHPLASNWTQGFRILSGDTPEGGTVALFRTVTPGYFETLGIGLLEGRLFTDSDEASAPGAVIINESLKRQFFPQGTALGQQLQISTTQWMWGDAIPTRFSVVGIVEDVRFHGPDQPSEAAFYLPFKQTPQSRMTVFARTRTHPDTLMPAVRRIVRDIDPAQPVSGASSMQRLLSEAVAQPRFNLYLVAGFGANALLLALVGLAGVLSYVVRQRLHEIGIRLALGAPRAQVLSLLLRQGVGPALAGLAAGTVAALLLSRMAASLLFEVSPTDSAVYAAAVVALVLAATIACLGPALRACRLDPLRILRAD